MPVRGSVSLSGTADYTPTSYILILLLENNIKLTDLTSASL